MPMQEEMGQLKAALEAAGVAASKLRQGLEQATAVKDEALQQLTVLKSSIVEPVTVMPAAGKAAAAAVLTASPPTRALATQPGAGGKDPVRRNLAVEQFVPRGGASGGAKKGGSLFATLAIPPASSPGANNRDSPAPPAKRTKSSAAPAPKSAAAKRGGAAAQKAGVGSQAGGAPAKAVMGGKKAAFVSALPDSADDPFAFFDDA
jgi:hypothetical protein